MNYKVSYISSFFSVYAVLLLLSVFIFIFLNVQYFVKFYKEQVKISVFFKTTTTLASANDLVKIISAKPDVKEVIFLDKEKALTLFTATYPGLEEDKIDQNILPESLEVYLQADALNVEKIDEIVTWISALPNIDEVRYDGNLVQKIEYNLKQIEFIFIALIILLLFVSIVLIHHTVKISLFSKRFLIRTMLLVGATKNFVYRPYLQDFLIIGVLSAVFTNITLAVFLYVIKTNYAVLADVFHGMMVFKVFIFVIILGVLITFLSAHTALRKYVYLSADEIY